MSFIFPTCLARFLASSSRRPLSTDLCTTFSQRPWTLSRRFLINTTSCFWLKYLRCVPVLSSSMIWSRCEFTSVTNTCNSSRSILRKKEKIHILEKDCFLKVQEHGENIFSHNVTDCMRNVLYYDHTVATYNAITADQVKQAHNVLWNNV